MRDNMLGMGSLLPFQGEFTEPRLSRGGERLGHVAAPGPPGPGPNLGLQTAALLHRSMHSGCEPSFTTRVLQLLLSVKASVRSSHNNWMRLLVITEKEMQCFSSLNTSWQWRAVGKNTVFWIFSLQCILSENQEDVGSSPASVTHLNRIT